MLMKLMSMGSVTEFRMGKECIKGIHQLQEGGGTEAVLSGWLVWKAGESIGKMGMMETNESKCEGGIILSRNNEFIIFPMPDAEIMTW